MPLAQQSGPQTWQQASATPTAHTYDVRSPHPSNPQIWQQPQSAHGYSTSSLQPPGPQAQQQESPVQPAQYHQPTSPQPSAGQTPVQTETDPVPQRLELPSTYHELRSMTTDSRTQEFLGTLEALPSVESLVGPRHSTSVTMRMAQYLLREEEEEQRRGMGGPPAD
ncbi:hypothetical protein CC85DRAFT_283653 [Cutaneotrichosporon oleaginosum]|uniref:Uncharacterized protein n=1 Tax=Cutaneotrichosporon oleaginosum TaxID=879819 RepID=A0A0J0XTL9_9TREE|nr:uncharacterized protein CC85DRAFT_283653 [Cutaneotrichosporon oleaginosum]KLT44426.1 hypothetical protein CC85DRAFT_283653 [Cutaneotrichosporon oleaginosum]TXT07854.1 hypothetical protein COLE_04778 [Cutaneotrichosporon oleaginosum]